MKKTLVKVTCVSCKKEVKVVLVDYGNERIAVCPVCNKLAYNDK